jgi:septum formation protein
MRVILASSSPRRKEILSHLGWKFETVSPGIVENQQKGETPEDLVKRLAISKGKWVAEKNSNALVIAADTIVYCNGVIYGKPENDANALNMLCSLSGQTHSVYSGIALFMQNKMICDCDSADVTFRNVDVQTLKAYIATGEPRGKAGAYAIQGRGGLFVKEIRGNYTTIVGLPVILLGNMLLKLGFKLTDLLEVS